MIGTCKLCKLENVELVPISHIIPDYFKDRIGELYRLGTNGKDISKPKLSSITFKQVETLSFDKYIFCFDCETKKLQSLDDYFLNKIIRPFDNISDMLLRRSLYGILYHEFIANDLLISQFIASIFWRVSISNQVNYKNFKLNTTDEERLRGLVFDNKIEFLNDWQYMILASRVDGKKSIIGIDHFYQRIYLGDFCIQYFHVSQKIPFEISSLQIANSNKVKLVFKEETQWMEELNFFTIKFEKQVLVNTSNNKNDLIKFVNHKAFKK